MKVVLKVTVYDRICADILKAHRDNREVDYVAVSAAECDELHRDPRTAGVLEYPGMRFDARPDISAVAAMRYYTFERTAARTHAAQRQCIQVVSDETFMGKPLCVVPKEYMPR